MLLSKSGTIGKVAVVAKEAVDPAAFAKELSARLNPARVADWRKYAEQREPEVREESPWVANYERRPG